MRDVIARAAEAGAFADLARRYIGASSGSPPEAEALRAVVAAVAELTGEPPSVEDAWAAIYPRNSILQEHFGKRPQAATDDFKERFAKAVR